MSSIVGVQGLEPTYNIIKFTKISLLLTKRQLFVDGI